MRIVSWWACGLVLVLRPMPGQQPEPPRALAGTPILHARLLDLDGEPVRKQPVAVLFVHERGMAPQEVTTGADGSLRVAVAEPFTRSASRVFVVRRSSGDGADTDYGGMAVYQLPADASGRIVAGDLRLVDEPPVFGGRLVDAGGKPIAGIAVAMARTWSEPVGERLTTDAEHDVLARALLHRGTTDAQGRFVFREGEPKPGPVRLEFGGGEWLGDAALRAEVGQLDQTIVVTKAASLRVDFRTRPPHALRVELRRRGADQVRGARRDETTGSFTFASIHAGRYDVRVLVHKREQLHIADVEVRAGQACADPRLRGVDWSKGLDVVRVRVRDAAGKAVRGASLQDVDDKGRAAGNAFPMPTDTETVVLANRGQRFAVLHESYRTVLVAPQPECEVVLEARHRVQLMLPEGLELPPGLVVELHALGSPGRLGPPSRASWAGSDTEILADGPGKHRLTLCALVERSPVVLWSGTIEVDAEFEPAAVVVPIDARDAKEVRLSFADLQRK